jgi:hypothetical protein
MIIKQKRCMPFYYFCRQLDEENKRAGIGRAIKENNTNKEKRERKKEKARN